MEISEYDLLGAMPRDMQYRVLLIVVSSYDVQWDIEYICERAGQETKVYHLPCDLIGVRIKRWDFMARTLLGWYKWETPSTQYLSERQVQSLGT